MPLALVSCSSSPEGEHGSESWQDDPDPTPLPLPPARKPSETYTQVTASAPRVRSGEEITIQVELRDDKFNRIRAGGHQVTFNYSQGAAGTSTGTFSPVIDHLDGTYSTRFKGQVAGTPIMIGATLAGKPLSKTASVAVIAGVPSAKHSTLTVEAPTVEPNKSVQVELTLRDENENEVTDAKTTQLEFLTSKGVGESRGRYNGKIEWNGAKASTRFIGTELGSATTLSAKINGVSTSVRLPTVTVQYPGVNNPNPQLPPAPQVPPPPVAVHVPVPPPAVVQPEDLSVADAARSSIQINPSKIPEGQTAKVTLELRTRRGSAVVMDPEKIQFKCSSYSRGQVKAGAVVQERAGVYTATITGTYPGIAEFFYGDGNTWNLAGKIEVLPIFSPAHSQLEAEAVVRAGEVIDIWLRGSDKYGNQVEPSPHAAIVFSNSQGPGISTGEFKTKGRIQFRGIKVGAPTTITATVNGEPLAGKVSVSVIPGPPSPKRSFVTVAKSKVTQDEQTEVKLHLRDSEDNITQDDRLYISFIHENIVDGSAGEFSKAVYLENESAFRSVFTAKGSGYPVPISTSWSRLDRGRTAPTIEVLLPSFFSRSNKIVDLPKLPVRSQVSSKGKGEGAPAPHSQGNPHEVYEQLNQCLKNYQEEWQNSDRIAHSIEGRPPKESVADSGPAACWNKDQLQEVMELRESIQTDLAELAVQSSGHGAATSQTNQEYRALLFRLGQNYQVFQEHLSYCRLKDLVHQGPRPTAVTQYGGGGVTDADKALLHVMGDIFGLESGLEGQTGAQALDLLVSRVGIIRTLMKQFERQKYIATARQSDPCSEIPGGYHPKSSGHQPPIKDFAPEVLQDIVAHGDQAVALKTKFDSSLTEFHQEYTRAVDGLGKVGDWFYFPGGSTKHAVVYQVTKTSDSTFSFSVYNSGDGLKFHTSILDGSKSLVYPRYERTQVPPEKLKRIAFLKALSDLKKSNGNSKMPFVYDNILRELGGTVTTLNPLLEDFLPSQLAGNCSYFVFPYMQTSLFKDSSLGGFLEFFVKSKLLDTYFKVNANRLSQQDHALRLANQTLHFYGEEITKNISDLPGHRDHSLDWGMARESQERLEYYREQLSNLVSERKRIRAQQEEVTVASISRNLKTYFNNFSLTDVSPILHRPEAPIKIKALDVENWEPTSKSLTKDLTNYLAELRPISPPETEDRAKETQRIIAGVEDIVKKLQLKDLAFLPDKTEELQILLGQLNDLSQLYFWALVNARTAEIHQNLGVSPFAILTQLKLLALADATLRAYSRSKDGAIFSDFPSLYSRLFEFFVSHKDPKKLTSLMSAEDSSWNSSLKEVSLYWSQAPKSQDGASAFGWEKVPLYSTESPIEISRHIYEYRTEQEDDRGAWSKPYGLLTSNELWKDLAWARSKLGSAAVENMVYSRYSKQMPREFFEIRDISFITHYLLTGSFHPQILKETSLKAVLSDVNYFADSHEQQISRPVSISHLRKGSEIYNFGRSTSLPYHKLNYVFFRNERGALSKTTVDTLVNDLIYMHSEGWNSKLYAGTPNIGLSQYGDRSQLGLWREIIENQKPYHVGNIPAYKRLTSEQIISEDQVVAKVPLKQDASRFQDMAVTSLEMQRQLLNLDTPLITLAYFREHPGLLLEKRWQVFFKALIFQPNLLADEFSKTSRFADLLTDFCWSNYETQFKDGDLLTAGFFLRMHQLFEEFIKKSENRRVTSYRLSHRAREGFFNLVNALPAGISDTRSLIYRDLIRTYRYDQPELWSSSEIVALIGALLYRDRNPLIDGANFEPSEEDAVSNLYMKKRIAFLSHFDQLSERVRQEILNRIYREFHPQADDLVFELKQSGHSKTYLARDRSNREVAIDLDRPMIFVDKNRETVLPGVISGFPKFKEVVAWNAENPPYVTWLGGQKYQLEDQKDHLPIRIDATPAVGKDQASFVIEKKWGSYWYQLLDDTVVNDTAVNTKGYSTENWAVMPGYQNWQSTQIDENGVRAPEAYDDKIADAKLRAKWEDISPKKGGSEILAFDPHTKKLFSVSRHPGRSASSSYLYLPRETVVQKAKYYGDRAAIEGKILSPGERTEKSKLFTRIETPRFIWIWTSPTQELLEVEFPRFKFSFNVDPKDPGKLVSHELDSYELSKKQTLAGLHEYPHYLVVERDGKEAVLIPRFKFAHKEGLTENDKERGLFPHYDLRWFDPTPEELERTHRKPIERYTRGSKKLFFFPVDVATGELVHSDLEERFYLAMIHLWGHSPEYPSYDVARDLIYSTRSQLGDFRKFSTQKVASGPREILEWISQLKNNDYDPRAIALQLGASLKLIENDLANHRYGPKIKGMFYPETYSDQAFMANLNGLYTYYLDTRDRLSTRWLPEDLERTYLNLLNAGGGLENDPRLTARLLELQGQPAQKVSAVSKGASSAPFSPREGWSISDFRYFSECSGSDPVSFFKGMDLNGLLGVSLRIHRGEQPAEMKDVVASLLGVRPSALDTLNSDDLKEEYFGVLRLLSRQKVLERKDDSSEIDGGHRACQKTAEFLYSLALTPKEKNLEDLERLPTFSSLKTQLSYFDSEKYEDYHERIKPFTRAFDRVTRLLPEESEKQEGPWMVEAPESRPTRFWDPRSKFTADPAASRELYAYDRKANPHSKYDLTELSVFTEQELHDCVSETDLAAAEKKILLQSKEELKQVFDAVPVATQAEIQDPFIKTRLSHVKDQLEIEVLNKAYAMTNCPSSAELKANLEKLKFELGPEIVALKVQIEKAASALPKDVWKKTQEGLFQESQIEARPTFKTLLHAYANRDLEKVMADSESRAGVQSLVSQITSYLVLSTYVSRLDKTLTALKQIDKSHASVDDLKDFYQLATQLRAYPISDHPELLVFEYHMRSLIRDDQLDKLKTLTEEDSAILEMIMGAGKTSVLLPLAARANAVANEKLSVVVLPESLVPSVVRQLSAQLEKNFGLGVDRLTISRSHKYDLTKLDFLYNRLRMDLETRRVVVTSNSSIQSLVLIFVEALVEYRKSSVEERPKLQKEIAQLQNIFLLLRDRAYVIIDEIDSILDIMASHRFSVGERGHLEKELVDATAGLFRLLAENKTIPKSVNLSFTRESFPGAAPFTPDAYHQLAKKDLIQAIARKESAEYFFEDLDQADLFRGLDMKGVEEFFEFKKGTQIQSYLDGLPNDVFRDVFATLYTQVHQILPMTLDKSYLVHYGLCPESALSEPTANGVPPCHPFISVPYHSGSPILTSRFGTDLESLNYTIQSHLERGDFSQLFDLEIKKLQTQYRNKRSQKTREKIQAYFGRKLADSQILNFKDSEIREQAKVVAKTPKLALKLIKTYAVPKIEVYPAQLFTNSHIYPLIFKNIKGMTGTLWNYESFPEFFRSRPKFSDSLARTLIALMKNADTRKVEVIDLPSEKLAADGQTEAQVQTQEIQRILSALFRGRPDLSIIDQGGLLRGRDNQLVAQLMLSGNKDITQNIFYDENHQIQLMREDLTTASYAVEKTDRSKTGAFWDMQHTTGSDLKIHPQGRALLTLNKFSILRDLLQSAWRLRDLEREQSVVIVIARDDLRVMSKFLTTHFGPAYQLDEKAATIPLESILLYLATNEAIKVGETNYRSVKGSLKAVVIETIFDTLLTQELGSNLFKAFSRVESFFKTPDRDPPRVRYGVPIVVGETDQFLIKETDRVFNPIGDIFKNLEELTKQFKKIIEKKKPSMMATIRTAENANQDDSEEVEIEAENEQEQQEEQEQEKEFMLHQGLRHYQQQTVRWDKDKFLSGNLPVAEDNSLVCHARDVPRLPPLAPLRNIFAQPKLMKYQDLFDKKLYVSLNLFPIYECFKNEFVPFGLYQGQIDHLMLVLDAQQKIEMLVLITRDEALVTLGEWIHELREEGRSPGQKSILIYQFGNGFIRSVGPDLKAEQGSPAEVALLDELNRNEKFKKLLIQVKILSGRVDFNSTEKQALVQWLRNDEKQKGKEREELVKKFVEEIILEFKESTRERYEHSVLHEVFRENASQETN